MTPEFWRLRLVAFGLVLYAAALAVAYLFSVRRRLSGAARDLVLNIEARPFTDEITVTEIKRAEASEERHILKALDDYYAEIVKAKSLRESRLYPLIFVVLRWLWRLGAGVQSVAERTELKVRRGYKDFHQEVYGGLRKAEPTDTPKLLDVAMPLRWYLSPSRRSLWRRVTYKEKSPLLVDLKAASLSTPTTTRTSFEFPPEDRVQKIRDWREMIANVVRRSKEDSVESLLCQEQNWYELLPRMRPEGRKAIEEIFASSRVSEASGIASGIRVLSGEIVPAPIDLICREIDWLEEKWGLDD